MSEGKFDNSYGLADIHSDLFEIMQFIHKICLENDIQYSLTGGSLLGAIRHGGFIPWDDDFDIMFDRANYEKFLSVMRSYDQGDYFLEADQWVYRVRKEHKTKGFVASIDLFVIDEVPMSNLKNKLQVLTLRFIQGMLRTNEKEGNFSLFYRVAIAVTELLGKLFNKEKLFKKYDKLSRMGNGENSGKISIFNDRFKLVSLQYDANLTETYELKPFHDAEFMIIGRYDDYLTAQFGDYMTPPPVEDRVPQHVF